MPLDIAKFPASAAELTKVIMPLFVPFQWTSTNAPQRFNIELPRVYAQLRFCCEHGLKVEFCKELARFVNFVLLRDLKDFAVRILPNRSDPHPNTWKAVQAVLTASGLAFQSPPQPHVEQLFYGEAQPLNPCDSLAKLLDTYWK